MKYEIIKDEFLVSTDNTKLDISVIHGFLTDSYWAKGIPIEIVKKSIEHSLCFGVYCNNEQIGFARVITDYTTFGYLADVFIVEGFRGKGLSKWLMECILAHPELQGFRRWSLATRDAHGLYTRYGFTPLQQPERMMEIRNPDAYKQCQEK